MNYWKNYEDKNILLCCLKLWTTRSRSGNGIKKGFWGRLRTCLWKKGGFWSGSWWEKSFFQAEAVQVSWARGSFKNPPEKIFLKKIFSWKWKTVLLIKLTISWVKLSQNILFQYFYREFNGFEVGVLSVSYTHLTLPTICSV